MIKFVKSELGTLAQLCDDSPEEKFLNLASKWCKTEEDAAFHLAKRKLAALDQLEERRACHKRSWEVTDAKLAAQIDALTAAVIPGLEVTETPAA